MSEDCTTGAQLRARSFRAQVRKLIRDGRVSFEARALWVLIESFADATGWNCFPSVPRLAKDSGHSEKWVQRHLRELETAGFLTRTTRKTTKGRSNEYSLKVPE